MGGLDFSDLTDDQIVELATGLAREAMLRNPALAAAFEAALVTERDRIHAQAKGAASQKAAALAEIQAQAERAERERLKAVLAQRERQALVKYLNAVGGILQRPASQLTLVWTPSKYGKGGPQLYVNAGQSGADAPWHLVTYIERTQSLHAAPAASQHMARLIPWARETCAVVRALGIQYTTVLHGASI